MNYKLAVTETGKKAGKYFYQVIDETGNVISSRNSNREYVACTIDGAFYFGRLDLIGKGDHGRMIKAYANADAATKAKYFDGAGITAPRFTLIAYK